MDRYEVVPYRVYVRDDGMRASIHGAVPWTSADEKTRWRVKDQGFTLYDPRSNTYGIGRPPCATREEAQAVADKLNAR